MSLLWLFWQNASTNPSVRSRFINRSRSPPETTTAVQSYVRGGSSTPWGRLKTQAWSARTPQCAFKSASPVEKRAYEAQLPPKSALAPRTQTTQVHQKHSRCPAALALAITNEGRGFTYLCTNQSRPSLSTGGRLSTSTGLPSLGLLTCLLPALPSAFRSI